MPNDQTHCYGSSGRGDEASHDAVILPFCWGIIVYYIVYWRGRRETMAVAILISGDIVLAYGDKHTFFKK